jgi:ferredoxin
MKVTVDEERCAGHGMCLTLCPEVFEMTDDGWAVADPGEVRADLESAAKDAVANCPEQAIVETDD